MMKPDKTLDELMQSIRANVVKAYKLLQTQNATDLSKTAAELAMQNFSVSFYVAEYEFESKSLEADYKHKVSITYMQERTAGQTEKNAEAIAKKKWYDLLKMQLDVSKAYRLARSCHGDVETLLDIMRSRIGILRQELNEKDRG